MSKVILRKLAISDVDDLLTINLNPDVTKYIPFMIRDRNDLLAWINSLSPADHEFMILLPHPDDTDSEIIGECSLDENGEIGLMILPEYWRKGYGTETVKQLMQLAEDLGLEAVTAQTDPENKACVGLLRSMGFTAKGMGWFIPEEAMLVPEAGMKLSHEMIMFTKDLEAAR